MNCGGGFWFWFTRPFAEFLGSIALGLFLLLVVILYFVVAEIAASRRKKKGN